MAKRRRFGRVRKLPSGRYQARYPGPDGIDRPADHTFATKTDAERWLSGVEADLSRGTWTDPNHGRVPLGDYLPEWIDHRPGLRPRTVDLYRWLYRRHIEPTLSGHALSDITPGTVRAWRAELLATGHTLSLGREGWDVAESGTGAGLGSEALTADRAVTPVHAPYSASDTSE